jgi:3-oxoacyl-[acyl-carrier protein] reductase
MGSDPLEGQGFVVVGGTGAMGRAVVLGAARRGASVLFSGPPGSEATAEEVIAAARSAGVAEQVFYVVADCEQQADVDRVFDVASERLPALNVLVVNLTEHPAALQAKLLIETSLGEWNQTLSANLRQPFLLTQRAVEEFLVGGKGGRIVYAIGMAEADAPTPASAAASRSALASLMRSVAKEYGRKGVACNLVSVPGGVDRTGRGAGMVLFLASPLASFIDGEALEVEA